MKCASVFLLLLSFLQLGVDAQTTVNLQIATFNVQIFGVKKIGNPEVTATLSQVS